PAQLAALPRGRAALGPALGAVARDRDPEVGAQRTSLTAYIATAPADMSIASRVSHASHTCTSIAPRSRPRRRTMTRRLLSRLGAALAVLALALPLLLAPTATDDAHAAAGDVLQLSSTAYATRGEKTTLVITWVHQGKPVS